MRRHNLIGFTLAGLGAAYAAQQAVRRSRRIDFRNRVVLITGGSRGLGLSLSRLFAEAGAKLALCARDDAELDRAKAELVGRYGAEVLAVQCDVTSRAQVDGMIRGVVAHFGRLDVLVNNAGVIEVGPLESMTPDDFQEAMATHFWGPLNTTLAALPALRVASGARIVNISSIGGKVAVPHLLPYSASKFALTGFSEGLRGELAKDGILVTTVCPGLMRTGSPRNAFFKGQHEKEYTWFMLSDSAPGLAMHVDRAARQVFDACRDGRAEITLSIPAKLAVTFHALFPGLDANLMGLINAWFMPALGGIGRHRARGAESETSVTRSALTTFTRNAERTQNELVQ